MERWPGFTDRLEDLHVSLLASFQYVTELWGVVGVLHQAPDDAIRFTTNGQTQSRIPLAPVDGDAFNEELNRFVARLTDGQQKMGWLKDKDLVDHVHPRLTDGSHASKVGDLLLCGSRSSTFSGLRCSIEEHVERQLGHISAG